MTSFLAQIPLFENLAADELGQLEQKMRTRTFPKNVIVIHEGDEDASLYFLLDGRVKIYCSDEHGREVLLNVLGPREYFGELSLLDGQPRSASVMTLEACKMAVLTHDAFAKFLRRHGEVMNSLLRALCAKLRRQNSVTKSLALDSVYERLRRLLTEAAEPRGDTLVVEGVSQRELAERVHASREMVTIILKGLKQGGYVAADRKKIILKRRLPKEW